MTREYSPQPGARWQTVVRHVETVVSDTSDPGHNELRLPQPNRAARRAAARARRKGKRATQPQQADTP